MVQESGKKKITEDNLKNWNFKLKDMQSWYYYSLSVNDITFMADKDNSGDWYVTIYDLKHEKIYGQREFETIARVLGGKELECNSKH
jgi:hypothetical protein